MKKGKLKSLDNNFYNKIIITKFKTKCFKFITFLASAKFIAIICIIMLIFIKNKTFLLITFLNILNLWLLVGILKNLVKRERPKVKRLVEEKGYSYPSGHTTTALIFYGLLVFFILFMPNVKIEIKFILTFLTFSVIALVGYSRIYLGVHYLSDIIGAFLIGASYLLIYTFFTFNLLNII